MQKLYTLLLFTLLSLSARAQLSIMFIDDSGDNFGNCEYLASTLDSLGYNYIYIDAIGQNYSPTAAEMSDYDLVIWHTSSWGLGLQFWNGNDEINGGLLEYLSQPNANLWLIGLDWIYDRHGAAPVTFVPGDFEYDQLGIAKHTVQSYADDGSLGVPVVVPSADQPIPGLQNIDWQFSTLWYVDGFELHPDAKPVYDFGGAGYSLGGTHTALLYHPAGAGRVLTYGFDLALASGFGVMRDHVGTVLNWWENEISTSVKSPAKDLASVSIAPNSFNDHLQIRVKMLETSPVTVDIYNTTGQLIVRLADQEPVMADSEKVIEWNNTAALPDGVYYCTVKTGQQVQTAKMVKQKR